MVSTLDCARSLQSASPPLSSTLSLCSSFDSSDCTPERYQQSAPRPYALVRDVPDEVFQVNRMIGGKQDTSTPLSLAFALSDDVAVALKLQFAKTDEATCGSKRGRQRKGTSQRESRIPISEPSIFASLVRFDGAPLTEYDKPTRQMVPYTLPQEFVRYALHPAACGSHICLVVEVSLLSRGAWNELAAGRWLQSICSFCLLSCTVDNGQVLCDHCAEISRRCLLGSHSLQTFRNIQ